MNTRSKSRPVGRHEIEVVQAQGMSEEAKKEKACFQREISQLRQELQDSKDKCTTLSGQVSRIESEKDFFLSKIKDLEKKINVDHARFSGLLNARDNEIGRLVLAKSALRLNYQDLMQTKVALDAEIQKCHKLLDGENMQWSGLGQPGEIFQEKGCEKIGRCRIL